MLLFLYDFVSELKLSVEAAPLPHVVVNLAE